MKSRQFDNNIAENIKKTNMSYSEIARRSGVTRATISAIACKKWLPSLVVAHKLSEALGMTIDEMIHNA